MSQTPGWVREEERGAGNTWRSEKTGIRYKNTKRTTWVYKGPTSTFVTQNKEGSYTVVGAAMDNDNNIYDIGNEGKSLDGLKTHGIL